MAILVIFGDKMADLGPIDVKMGLYIKVNINDWQKKFEVHISEHLYIKVNINDWQKKFEVHISEHLEFFWGIEWPI